MVDLGSCVWGLESVRYNYGAPSVQKFFCGPRPLPVGVTLFKLASMAHNHNNYNEIIFNDYYFQIVNNCIIVHFLRMFPFI